MKQTKRSLMISGLVSVLLLISASILLAAKKIDKPVLSYEDLVPCKAQAESEFTHAVTGTLDYATLTCEGAPTNCDGAIGQR